MAPFLGLMPRPVLGVGLAFTLVAVSAGVVAGSIPNPTDGRIYGCYDGKSGALRVIDSPSKSCTKFEVTLWWNQIGPAGGTGPAGPTGNTGQTGATGPAGPVGAKGDTGAPGDPGAPGAKGDTGAPGDPGAPGAKGDTGAPGAPGLPGANGTNGVSGYERVSNTDFSTGAVHEVSVGCPAGKVVLGGGFFVPPASNLANGDFRVAWSRPDNNNTWTAHAELVYLAPDDVYWTLTVYAVCAAVGP